MCSSNRNIEKEDEYLEKTKRDYLNGDLSLDDFIRGHYKLKEKYSKILDDVHDYRYETSLYKLKLINLMKHFNVKTIDELSNIYLNQPYKFEDLQEDMWVYHQECKCCRQIHKLYNNGDRDVVQFKSNQYPELAKCYYFEQNHFFPVQKANEMTGNKKGHNKNES